MVVQLTSPNLARGYEPVLGSMLLCVVLWLPLEATLLRVTRLHQRPGCVVSGAHLFHVHGFGRATSMARSMWWIAATVSCRRRKTSSTAPRCLGRWLKEEHMHIRVRVLLLPQGAGVIWARYSFEASCHPVPLTVCVI